MTLQVSIKEAERHLQDQQAHRAQLNKHMRSLRDATSTGLNTDADTQLKIYQSQLSLWLDIDLVDSLLLFVLFY